MADPRGDHRLPTSASETAGDWLRRKSQFAVIPIVRVISRTGMTPNTLTVLGFLLNVAVAAVLARGALSVGGVLLLVAASFDALDGTLARMTHQQSRFGGFFDSTLDRYSEAVVFSGLLVHYIEQGAHTTVYVLYAAIIGSLMVSYARARAEGLGASCKVGLATRVERVLILAAGLIVRRATLALWLIAILANLTVVQRIAHVRRALQDSEDHGAA